VNCTGAAHAFLDVGLEAACRVECLRPPTAGLQPGITSRLSRAAFGLRLISNLPVSVVLSRHADKRRELSTGDLRIACTSAADVRPLPKYESIAAPPRCLYDYGVLERKKPSDETYRSPQAPGCRENHSVAACRRAPVSISPYDR